jgi:hypothetical protein
VGAGAGELTFRQAFIRRFPYKVIFLERPDEIMILACAHSRQRPGYWRRRLPK